MNRNEIIERLNADDWEQVEFAFGDSSRKQINRALDMLWPQDERDNIELAQAIYDELND